jgi:hypothetical protein
MKKARDRSQYQEVHLYPEQRACPACRQPLAARYRKRRWITTLSGELSVLSHCVAGKTGDCALRGASYRPEQEDVLALRGYSFGLDVVTRIGQLRYRAHRSLPEIHHELQAAGVKISVKEVALLSEVFLALVTTVASDDPQLVTQLEAQGGIILALDGVQPEKGNETLYLLRDRLSGRVLVARNLLSSASSEIEQLIAPVLALGVPILGVVSDKQESLCLAISRKLPGVPHQICHYHYLKDVAQPVCDADRKLKKELKQKIRGVREVERKVEHDTSAPAQVVRDYCLAIRTVLHQDGKYPLEPAGVTLYQRLQLIATSLQRTLAQRPSLHLQRLHRLLLVINQYAGECAWLSTAFGWIHHLARLLQSAEPRAVAEQHLVEYAAGLEGASNLELGAAAAHIQKLTSAFVPYLFAYLEQPLLPRTNNELEVFIGQLKKARRHATGRKNTTEFILREGSAVAILFGLPAPTDWLASFAHVNVDHFQQALQDLRRPDERSKRWQIRRDLPSYLSGVEGHWQPSEVEDTDRGATYRAVSSAAQLSVING